MSRLPSTPTVHVPPGACDCHMHFFGPLDRYPPIAKRFYTPVPVTIDDYTPVASALGLSRVVVVTPSAYGVDNRCTLDHVAALGERARAVVVVDPGVTENELAAMHRAGARGVRFNLINVATYTPAEGGKALIALADRLGTLGWHAQFFMKAADVGAVADAIVAAEVPVVFDHSALPNLRQGVNEPGFRTVLKLLGEGRCFVKLSGLHHLFDRDPVGEERHLVDPFVKAMVAANPDQLLFATDWPHVGVPDGHKGNDPPPAAHRASDDGADMSTLLGCIGDEKIVDRILRDNPARLYGFR